jgi:hypothetical protein
VKDTIALRIRRVEPDRVGYGAGARRGHSTGEQ